MKTTFNDILNSMKQAFFDECGHNVDNIGDISARFNVVASEIYSLYCSLDYAKRQSYLQTACGEHLDYHAQLRNMHRNPASKATGILTFSISEPISVDINIPADTICSVKGKPFIQFKTDVPAVLKAGDLSVDAPATALETGDDYNASAYSVTVLVNAPSRIEHVTNINSFSGGYREESDDALRKRLINSFKFLPTGLGVEYVEDCIRELDGVIDCKIVNVCPRTSERVKIYVWTNTGSISNDLRRAMEEKTTLIRMMGLGYDYLSATALAIDLMVESSADRQDIVDLTKEYFSTMKIGESLNLVDYKIWLAKRLDDVGNIVCNQANGQYVICPSNQYISINSIEVLGND